MKLGRVPQNQLNGGWKGIQEMLYAKEEEMRFDRLKIEKLRIISKTMKIKELDMSLEG